GGARSPWAYGGTVTTGQRVIVFLAVVGVIIGAGLALAPSPYLNLERCGSPVTAAFRSVRGSGLPTEVSGASGSTGSGSTVWSIDVGTNAPTVSFTGSADSVCRSFGRSQLAIAAVVAGLSVVGGAIGFLLFRGPPSKSVAAESA